MTQAKATHLEVTRTFLRERELRCKRAGYPKQKWIEFCELCLESEFTVHLYEARKTHSKYVTVSRSTNGKRFEFKVRFSNHPPIAARERQRDCDFFVGRTNLGIYTTEQAIYACAKHFDFLNLLKR